MSPAQLGGALLVDEGDDGPRALVPAGVRRHLPDRLGGEQLHQPVDVVGLERRDVAGQQVLRLRRIRGRQPVVEPGPTASSWDRARCSRLLTAVVVVPIASATSADLPLQHVAQQQHRALPGREVLQRGDKRQPHRLARPDDDRRVGRVVRQVGQRLQPGHLAAFHELGRRVGAGTFPARSAAAGAAGPPARSGRCWWRCDAARSGSTTCLRIGR